MPFAATPRDYLSEEIQKERNKDDLLICTCGIWKNGTDELTCRAGMRQNGLVDTGGGGARVCEVEREVRSHARALPCAER